MSRAERWYLFLDESYGKQIDPRRLIVSCVLCRQRRWDERAKWAARIGAMSSKKRLPAIRKGLPQFGFAILGYADVPAAMAVSGEIDGTRDIPKMARMDNLWSILFLSVMTATLARFRGAGLQKARLSVYYDQQSLTVEHRQSIQKTIQNNVARIAMKIPRPASRSRDWSSRFRYSRKSQKAKREKSQPHSNTVPPWHTICALS